MDARMRFPATRQYSCSSSYQTLSRIDLAIGSESVLPLVRVVEYLPRSVLDHSPMRVQLALGHVAGVPAQPWHLNPFWAQLIHMALLRELEEFFQLHSSCASPSLTWEAVSRGLYTREISKPKSRTRELTQALQQHVSDTEAVYISDPSDQARVDWVEAQDLLKDHMLTMADKKILCQQKYFNGGRECWTFTSYQSAHPAGPLIYW